MEMERRRKHSIFQGMFCFSVFLLPDWTKWTYFMFTPCRSLEAAHTICRCWMKPTLCWSVYSILLQVYLWAITVTHISLRGFQWHPCKLCTSKAVAVLVTPPLHPSKVHRKDLIYTLCLPIVLISSLFLPLPLFVFLPQLINSQPAAMWVTLIRE